MVLDTELPPRELGDQFRKELELVEPEPPALGPAAEVVEQAEMTRLDTSGGLVDMVGMLARLELTEEPAAAAVMRMAPVVLVGLLATTSQVHPS